MNFSAAQLTGLDGAGLVEVAPQQRLHPEVAQAFERLQGAAVAAGFDLQIASAHRDFERQLQIWNGKARGERPIHDDGGRSVDAAQLSPSQLLHAILRFSALPGSSRHHWGTDLDVFDAAAMAEHYQLQLSPQEVARGGLFDPLHCWLDEQMQRGESEGFFRPYTTDSGGLAPERWHLSYAPLAQGCAQQCSAALIAAAWSGRAVCLLEDVEQSWGQLYARYVQVAPGWCPAPAN